MRLISSSSASTLEFLAASSPTWNDLPRCDVTTGHVTSFVEEPGSVTEIPSCHGAICRCLPSWPQNKLAQISNDKYVTVAECRPITYCFERVFSRVFYLSFTVCCRDEHSAVLHLHSLHCNFNAVCVSSFIYFSVPL